MHIPNGESDVIGRATVGFVEWAKILGKHLARVGVGACPSSVGCLRAVGGRLAAHLRLQGEIGVAFLSVNAIKIVSTDAGTTLQVCIEINLNVIWVRL